MLCLVGDWLEVGFDRIAGGARERVGREGGPKQHNPQCSAVCIIFINVFWRSVQLHSLKPTHSIFRQTFVGSSIQTILRAYQEVHERQALLGGTRRAKGLTREIGYIYCSLPIVGFSLSSAPLAPTLHYD